MYFRILIIITFSISIFSCSLFSIASINYRNLWPDIDLPEYEMMPEYSYLAKNKEMLWKTIIKKNEDSFSEIIAYGVNIKNGYFYRHCKTDICQESYRKAKQTILSSTAINMLTGEETQISLNGISNVIFIKNEKVIDPSTWDEIVNLYQPYNTIEKAIAFLHISGYPNRPIYYDNRVETDRIEQSDLIKATDNGFDAIVINGFGCDGYEFVQLFLDFSGSIKILRSKIAKRNSKGCRI